MTSGIVNIVKPPGMTSHDVVSFVRRVYGLKRVGHAGTLDPAAAGVLPVFLGSATRIIEYSTDADKAYRVEMTFGYSTDSGDTTGKVLRSVENPVRPQTTDILAAMKRFTGNISQIPPMLSAIKVEGKKLYELAREGVEIERKPRPVTIHEISLVTERDLTILFDVSCSKGTYIRSLCIDLGEALQCPTVMSFLVRTRVGGFKLADAHTLEEVAAAPEAVLLPADHAASHLPSLALDARQMTAFGHGQTISCSGWPIETLLRIYDAEGRFSGIGRIGSAGLLPHKVILSDQG